MCGSGPIRGIHPIKASVLCGGGAFYHRREYSLRSSHRKAFDPVDWDINVGYRCADCSAGFAGPGCVYSDAVICSDKGTVANDGTCTCDEGFGSSDCSLVQTCGNGVVEGTEECDDGSLNSDTVGACRTSCVVSICGDGVKEGTEGCDDGEETSTCNANCSISSCGDGVRNTSAGEACDDANDDDSDGCRSDWRWFLSPRGSSSMDQRMRRRLEPPKHSLLIFMR